MVANNPQVTAAQAIGLSTVAAIGVIGNAFWFQRAETRWDVFASSAGFVICSLAFLFVTLMTILVKIFPASLELPGDSGQQLSVIYWHNVADGLPEYHGRKVRYLVAWGRRPFVQEGIWTGTQWGDQTGCEIRAVWAWAPMPVAPPYPESDPVAELFKSNAPTEVDAQNVA